MTTEVNKYIDENVDKWVNRLRQAVEIPSVSADPAHRPDMLKMADFMVNLLKELGANNIVVHKNPKGSDKNGEYPPILTFAFGEKDPSLKHVCIYGHLDVQPAKLEDGWDWDPFKLTVNGEGDAQRLCGRGATDDKGPVLAWLNAIESYHAVGKKLGVYVSGVFELMEESGSEGLEEFIEEQKDKLFADVDYFCISDSYWLADSKPCVTYGLRGCAYYYLHVECANMDLHSGVYGGPTAEAMQDLVKIMASFNDPSGRIAVEGIYDDVAPVTAEEDATYESIDFDPETFRKDLGANKLRFQSKADILKSRWRYPTLSLHGIQGAFADAGAKTVIPHAVTGKFSLRLVPDMKPERVTELLQAHINKVVASLQTPNKVTLEPNHAAPGWISKIDSPNYVAARKAVKNVWDVEPDLIREGGSIPLALWFENATGKSVLLLPIGGANDRAHSTNESIATKNYIEGTKVLASYLDEISKM